MFNNTIYSARTAALPPLLVFFTNNIQLPALPDVFASQKNSLSATFDCKGYPTFNGRYLKTRYLPMLYSNVLP